MLVISAYELIKLDVRDDKGKTPLMVAAQSNQHIVAFLFECVSSRHLVGF